MGEFDLISSYFDWDSTSSVVSTEKKNTRRNTEVTGVVIGIGDDAAILQLDNKQQLVTSIDTLISGVHFPINTPAAAIAHKALMVNLSDLAAMGAQAKWFTLALTLPTVDHDWLRQFSMSLRQLAEKNSIKLVGGDTTKGPLSISIQVMGTVEKNTALLRSGAKTGDNVFVTGTLGDAAAGLASIQGRLSLSGEDKLYCEARLNFPTARLEESDVIKQYASSCIDVSDGLLQDLGHILKKSKAAAILDLSKLPYSESLKKLDINVSSDEEDDEKIEQSMKQNKAQLFAQNGGDDYELLFTVPAEKQQEFMAAFSQKSAKKISTRVTMIGEITDKLEIGTIIDMQGKHLKVSGYNHFADDNL